MSIYKLLLLRWSATLSLLFFLFVSCADQLDSESTAEEPNVYVTLDLSMPGSGLPKTRMNTADQDALKDIRVLVFDKADSFRYTASIAELNAGKVTVRLIASAGTEEYKLVLLANVPDDPAITKPADGESRTSLLKRYVFTCTNKWGDSKPLPMWGETQPAVVKAGTVFDDQAGVGAIQMYRALARVDVGLNFTNPNLPTDNTASGLATGDFKLKSVRVYNSMNGGLIFGHPTALTTPPTPQTPNLPSPIGINTTNPLKYDLTADETNAHAYCGNIFLPEAQAGTQAGDPNANFLVVSGYYGVGNTKDETFYRVDFIDGSNTPLALLRNNLYRVNITKVSNAGYATVEEARLSTPANMTASVVAWKNSALTDIVFNGPDFFSCASKTVVLPFEANGKVGIEVASSVPASAWTITSSAKVKVTKPADSALQGSLEFEALGKGGTAGGLANGEEVEVTVTVKSLKMTFVVRQAQTAKASATPGVPSIGGGEVVEVPGQGKLPGIRLSGANCFIANKVGTYVLNASIKGNGVQAMINPKEGVLFPANAEDVKVKGGKTAEVLWETVNTKTVPTAGTVVKDVSYNIDTQEIIFTTTEQEGNAVIAVRDKDNIILWSWHIWRANFNPEQVKMPMKAMSGFTLKDGDLVMMDRNLGALNAIPQNPLSTGLFYQWGRKDPMPGSYDFSSSGRMATTPGGIPILPTAPFTTTDNIAKSIQEPTTFMRYGLSWTSVSNDLWGTPFTDPGTSGLNLNKGAKTIYDPCPPGWRVPPAFAFLNAPGKVDYRDDGCLLNIFTSRVAWLPASGYLDGRGGVTRVGARIWTSSPISGSQEKAICLKFDSANESIGEEGRANAHNCRCIKEIKP